MTLLVVTLRVNAAETVVLQYRDHWLQLPLAELQAFAKGGQTSPALQAYLQTVQTSPEDVRKWLTTSISPPRNTLLPEEFVLLQISKTLGDVSAVEDLGSLRTALGTAYRGDRSFSVLEVLQSYPKGSVRLTLNRLGQAYADINLFVTRIEPIFQVAKALLPELVCDCLGTPTPSQAEAVKQSPASVVYSQSHNAIKALFTTAEPRTALVSQLPAVGEFNRRTTGGNRDRYLAYENTQVVFAFGPIRPSISVGELTRFVETGALSPGWRSMLRLAKVNPENLRTALAQEVTADLQFLDTALNSLLGEFALYQVAEILQTPSGSASTKALRSAIILAADDNRFSLLELLQHYPTTELHIDGVRLARLGKTASRLTSQGDPVNQVADIEGWLVQLQTSAADAVCKCEQGQPADGAGSTSAVLAADVPQISAATLAKFLPAEWQPVAPHREDRGPIKVVWLAGTPYEMGYQHGQLLHDEIASLGQEPIDIARFIGKGFGFGRLAAKRSYPSILDECAGLVDATHDLGITTDVCLIGAYADVFQEVLGYTLPKELFWDGCNQFVAANAATTTGQLYHGSSVDNDAKPVPYVINNPVVFVRQPVGALPHVFVTYPAVVWPNSGMNVAGVSLGLDTAHPNNSEELSLVGRSNVQIMAKVLETATSFDEARTLMETQPRVRANLIMITDGKSKQAGVFEFTGKSLGIRGLQENGVLYTTNHMVLPEMADRQAQPLDPSSLSRFDRLSQLLEPEGSSSYYGQIDPSVMAKILRDRVNPYTGEASPLDLFDDDASPGGNGALRQAIYDPAGLRFWVAAGPPPVPENPFVCFSMGQLLKLPNAAPCNEPTM